MFLFQLSSFLLLFQKRDDDDVFKQLLSQAAAAVEAKDHRMEDLLGLQEQMKKMNLSIAETIARLTAKLERVYNNLIWNLHKLYKIIQLCESFDHSAAPLRRAFKLWKFELLSSSFSQSYNLDKHLLVLELVKWNLNFSYTEIDLASSHLKNSNKNTGGQVALKYPEQKIH